MGSGVRVFVVTILSALTVTGCGGDHSGHGAAGPPPSGPVGPPQAFPSAQGKTVADLLRGLGPGPRLASSVSALEPGRDRIAYALFDRARRQIGDTPSALYVADANGRNLRGPFHASYESLAVTSRYRSATVANDPDSAQSIYVSEAEFPAPGSYTIVGVVQLDQRLVGSAPTTVTVRSHATPPDVGQLAPRVHTPTTATVQGDLRMIDTRSPPDSMHSDDLADVLGRRPVMLLFASPALCHSRTCGPVVDELAELKGKRGRDAAFIHMEIYKDNNPQSGQRDQVRAYRLPSQPWLFAIDRSGHVAARIEGAFSEDEANSALDAAVAGAAARR